MSLKATGGRKEFKTHIETNSSYGVLNKFTFSDTSADLTPSVTDGVVILPGAGRKKLVAADFTTPGDIADDDRTAVFYDVSDDDIYYNLTGTPDDPEDYFLGTMVAASGDITQWWPAVANATQLVTPDLAVDSTGDKIQLVFPGLPNGLPGRLMYAWFSASASTTVTAPVVSIQHIDNVTGTNTVIDAVTFPLITLDLDGVTNCEVSNMTGAERDSAIWYPGDRVCLEVTTAATAGDGYIGLVFGGYHLG